MTTEAKRLSPTAKKLRRQIAASRARAAKWRKEHPGELFPFAKLLGVWKGANFTDEEIDAVKIRVRDLPD